MLTLHDIAASIDYLISVQKYHQHIFDHAHEFQLTNMNQLLDQMCEQIDDDLNAADEQREFESQENRRLDADAARAIRYVQRY
tara:strand:- start:295 stop:543 length:249 start_codon:yes stop_codon:yes gene_type:complete